MIAAIYIDYDDELPGKTGKIIHISDFADYKGWNYQIFQELSNSDESWPIKKKLMSRLLRGEYKILLICNFNEWSSGWEEFLQEINKLKEKEVRVISYSENFDTDSGTGMLYLKVISIFSDFEKSLVSKTAKQFLNNTVSTAKRSRKLQNNDFEPYEADSAVVPKSLGTNFDLVDMTSAALLTGYSKHALYRMVCRHQVPFLKRQGGRKLFFSKRALEDCIINDTDNRIDGSS